VTEPELEALYQRYGFLVHRRCLAVLNDEAEADDATQEVFLRAYERLPASAAPYALAWLYATANHHCFDVARRNKRRDRQAQSVDLSAPRVASPVAEGRTEFLWLFGPLDARTSEIGVLHFIDGFTQEEIALRTGISRKTIGKRLRELQALLARREGATNR
jgi:RNA polymerase sigma factor (sigma-70 family)